MPAMSRRYPLRFDATFVEQAVRAVAERLPPAAREAFHREREPIYEEADPDRRDARFRRLHGRWFRRLGLAAPFDAALAERPGVAERTRRCHVCAAAAARDEHADLLVPESKGRKGRAATLAVRVRPERFLDPDGLRALLRRELLHVADMLDPAFGYRPSSPHEAPAPALENLFRERYRVLWSVTVDGRLSRERRAEPGARERRRREFGRAFPMLAGRLDREFVRWFEAPRPRHQDLAAFARDPLAAAGRRAGWSGSCPLCRMPGAPSAAGYPSPGTLRLVRESHPGWDASQGMCGRCALVFEGLRVAPQAAAPPSR
jgi:hypothetical protein